jgi:replicative DNA helicase
MTLPALEQLPPHDIEAEEAVISALLVDPEAIYKVTPILKAEDFFREKNAWVYECCVDLWNRDEAINQITVAHELARKDRLEEAGGQTYLSDIIRQLPTSIGVEFYAGIVQRDSKYRGLVHASTGIMQMAYTAPPDIETVFLRSEELIQRLREGNYFRDFIHIRDLLQAYLEEDMEALAAREHAAIQTGFQDLDALLGGMKRADLVIVGARPSVGKSAFALGIARNAAINQNATVGFFSLEMSSEQLATRLLAAESGVDSTRLRLGQQTELEERRVIRASGELAEANIWFDDSPVLTMADLRAKARRLAGQQGLDLLVLDYLQLMNSDSSSTGRDNRVQEISFISRGLKGLARELNVPIIALAQLSRAIEQRQPHTPLLSDLRDSGSIEQDADVVMFLSREDMYVTQQQWAEQHPDMPATAYPRGVARVDVAKHRNGPTGSADLRFRSRLAKFEDWVLRKDDDEDEDGGL